MLRVNVWRTAPDRHTILFVAHHVAVDEWSVGVFERELWALYRAGGDLAVAALPPLAVGYADYAVWHRGLVARQAQQDLTYWRGTLDGAPPPVLPLAQGAHDRTGGAGERARLVPAARLAGLDRIRTQAGATEFMLYLAVYACCWPAGPASVTHRRHPGVRADPSRSRSAGRASSSTPWHCGLPSTRRTTSRRICGACASVVLAAFAHQEAPFEHVVRAVAPDRADGVNPLFRTLFSFLPGTQADRMPDGDIAGLTLRDLPVGTGGNHFDLSLGTARTAAGLHLNLEFSTELVDERAADELLTSFTELLATLGESPQAAVAELLNASETEQQRIADWTGVDSAPACDVPVHELLRDQVALSPDLVAVESSEESLTFAQLAARSAALARRLVADGVRRGDLVGLHLPAGLTR